MSGLRKRTNGAPTLQAEARPAFASGDAGSSRGLCSCHFPRCRFSTMDATKQVINFGPGPAKLPHSVRWLGFGQSAGIGMRGVGMRLASGCVCDTDVGERGCHLGEIVAEADVRSCARTQAFTCSLRPGLPAVWPRWLPARTGERGSVNEWVVGRRARGEQVSFRGAQAELGTLGT